MTSETIFAIEHEIINDFTTDIWGIEESEAKESLFFISGICEMARKLAEVESKEREGFVV